MKILLAVALLLLSGYTANAKSWRGITPLHSTRSDVERLLGAATGECRCFYDTDNERIRVEYATAPCAGYPSGWNVAADTVLTLYVSLKQRLDFSELKLTTNQFEKAADDAFYTYYASRLEGVQYTVNSEGKLNSVSYFPPSTDSHLRCPCYPLQDESTQRSIHFDQFAIGSMTNALSRIDSYVIQLFNNQQWKGYVILYAGKRTSAATALQHRRAITRHLIRTRGLPRQRLVMIDGGYRDEPYIELFLLTEELSPPEPRPTWVPCRKNRSR